MDDHSRGPLPANWGGLLVLLAVALGGVWWAQSPLRSSRPSEPPQSTGPSDEKLCRARLWQDPFGINPRLSDQMKRSTTELFTETCEPADSESADGKSTDSSPLSSVREPAPEPWLVLAVLVSGAPYAEAIEGRVKSRVAIISGLAAAGYAPEDTEHLRFLDWEEGIVPYEWFLASSLSSTVALRGETVRPQFTRVLVLWLDEDRFQRTPLCQLGGLHQDLCAAVKTCSQTAHPHPLTFRVLGPSGSTTLAAIYREAGRLACGRTAAPLGLSGIRFYCATATADDAALSGDGDVEPSAGFDPRPRARLFQRLRQIREIAPIGFWNLTCTDDQLVDELTAELARRGVDPSRGDRIALIAEHDTHYGRALPLSFIRAGQQHWKNPRASEMFLGEAHPVIRCFSYLRGLDGNIPREEIQASRDASASDKGKKFFSASEQQTQRKTLELPEGNSQLDYIPRLAARLRQWDAVHGTTLRAIGILGSDTYDKLLLLQSLRTQYPNAIFFTTDLDARLFHPRELDWTRNLLVASSYGLELAPALQQGFAPFRSCYQTALFRAAREAVQSPPTPATDEGELAKKNDFRRMEPAPQLFEIGFEGAHNLSVATDEGISPPRLTAAWFVAFQTGLWILLLGLAVWQLTPYPSGWLRGLASHPFWVFAVAAALLLYLGLIIVDHTDAKGEPFSLFEGISIWPAQLLRLAAAVLGLILLGHTSWALQESRRQLEHDFRLTCSESASSAPEPNTSARRSRWTFFCHPLRFWLNRRFRSISRWAPPRAPSQFQSKEETPVNIPWYWSRYCRLSEPGSRWWRVLPAAGVYLVALLGMVAILGFPAQPHRGTLSGWANTIALTAGVVSFLLLTAYVLDATRLCRRAVILLAQAPTQWPTALLEQWEQRLKVDRKYLDEWLDMQFLARLTGTVSWLIWYPCLVLVLLIFARNPYFDAFDWPLSMWLIMGLNTAFAISSAFLLHRAARTAREQELERLQRKLIAAQHEGGPTVAQLEALANDVRGLQKGAFAPLSANPVVHSLLLLAGGISIPALLEYWLANF